MARQAKSKKRLIATHKLLCSMSAKGNSLDNACTESFAPCRAMSNHVT